jgi:putative transposon-encoded protein
VKPLTLSISGDKKIEQLIRNKMGVVREGVVKEIGASAQNIVRESKRRAPVDQGALRNSIGYKMDTEGATAMVASSYGAYIEFGTGGKVNIPNGFADFAAQFKGNSGGGNLGDMLNDLAEWVRRKGLAGTYSVKTGRRTGKRAARANQDLEVAYAIMWSILKKGIAPQPFFIPSYLEEKPKLLKRLIALLSK